MSETQYPGWRLHRRRGEALKYFNNLSAASLVSLWSGATPALNFAPILPAGTFVDINGQYYVTRNAMQSGEWGEIDPLNWHPTYIVPKKSTDSFVDRASVYWDETNCYATSTSSGNKFIGYAVSNGEVGSATNGTSAALATGTVTQPGMDSQVKSYTVTGGTAADGKLGSYQSGDMYMEIEVVYSATTTVSASRPNVATVAAAGSTISDAAAIAEGFTLATGADGTKGVLLPVAAVGMTCSIKNRDSDNAILKIWPQSGTAINALSASAAFSIAAKTSVILVAFSSTEWYSVPLLPS